MGSSVVTRNISPAPSQSLVVMMGGVDVDKALLLEEAVDGGSRDRADAEHGAEQVGARAQVLLGAQELDGCALLLQRVIRGRSCPRPRWRWQKARKAGAHRGVSLTVPVQMSAAETF